MQMIRIKPDLIFLDAAMPNLDGYELCSLLRRYTVFKQTPIIVITENSGLMDRLKSNFSGASDSLAKPFTQPGWLKIISKFLNSIAG